MAVEDHHLAHAMRSLGRSLLSLELSEWSGDSTMLAGGFAWAGMVQVRGDFNGGFAIRCGTHAAESMARGLVQETGSLSDELIQATIVELTHLLAGSLVPLMEGSVKLEPALAMQGSGVTTLGSSSRIEARSTHDLDGEAVEVTLFRS